MQIIDNIEIYFKVLLLIIALSMRGKKAPLLRGAVVGIGLGLYQ